MIVVLGGGVFNVGWCCVKMTVVVVREENGIDVGW